MTVKELRDRLEGMSGDAIVILEYEEAPSDGTGYGPVRKCDATDVTDLETRVIISCT